MTKQTVLFLCTGNSARSQIAEVLLRHHASDQFEVYSAGAQPEAVHSCTYEVLKAYGIESGSLRSKPIDEFMGMQFDYVITLCDHASQECKSIPYQGKRLEWNFPDPKQVQAISYPAQSFEESVQAINRRITSFLNIESHIKPEAHEPSLSPTELFKSLGDPLRLKTLMLVQYEGELCVCELMQAIDDSQPKVSRHLALLRKQGILSDRKQGQWVFYRIHPALPKWAKSILSEVTDANIMLIKEDLDRLYGMGERPSRSNFCNA